MVGEAVQQRLPRHQRRHDPAAGHSDRHQRHGEQHISTGDTVLVKGKIGRAVIKARGARVALYGTKPQVSARITDCRLITHRPGHTIRWGRPSQQEHRPPTGETTITNIATKTNGTPSPDARNS